MARYTKKVLLRMRPDTHAAACELAAAAGHSDAVREALGAEGRGSSVAVQEIIRRAIEEGLARLGARAIEASKDHQ